MEQNIESRQNNGIHVFIENPPYFLSNPSMYFKRFLVDGDLPEGVLCLGPHRISYLSESSEQPELVIMYVDLEAKIGLGICPIDLKPYLGSGVVLISPYITSNRAIEALLTAVDGLGLNIYVHKGPVTHRKRERENRNEILKKLGDVKEELNLKIRIEELKS